MVSKVLGPWAKRSMFRWALTALLLFSVWPEVGPFTFTMFVLIILHFELASALDEITSQNLTKLKEAIEEIVDLMRDRQIAEIHDNLRRLMDEHNVPAD